MQENGPAIACDVLVIGGGINGAGIARDAAGRGLSVVLCEKDDLAAHTSSASTKLIHGGLRYLEYHEFGLVRKALAEREVLLRAAPHLIAPLSFVMPHDTGQRPAWMIRAGLFLYDHLAKRELLPGSRVVDLRRHEAGKPLQAQFVRGFTYADGWVDDARLVVINAVDAAARGATVFTRTGCVSAERRDGLWHAVLSRGNGKEVHVAARFLVNAAGPWATQLLTQFARTVIRERAANALRLVKGSHIVVRKLFDHPHAYIFQHPDGRIVFAIPYQRNYTLIGTTDIEYHGDPGKVAIEGYEIDYLCALCARYFRKAVTPDDVVWTYSGVRPLLEDEAGNAAAVTRDYRLAFERREMLLSIFGGKLTTYRKLAEEAVNIITQALGHRVPAWTAETCLPGGDLYGERPQNRSVLEFDAYVASTQQRYVWLPPALVARYVRAYGTRLHTLLGGRNGIADMGEEIAPGLYAAEVEYLMRYEWARCADDILWRRSKLGLQLPQETGVTLDAWIAAHGPDMHGPNTQAASLQDRPPTDRLHTGTH